MIIHSVTPIQYLLEDEKPSRIRAIAVAGGQLEGQDTPQGFVATRLYSTDPALYLKNEYKPGSIFRG
ncbi:MAG: YlzJ-like family protein [Oscillospiraceae bacterium]|nr:YlzJ-like family protein [Oscillospiraceae bacterium]